MKDRIVSELLELVAHIGQLDSMGRFTLSAEKLRAQLASCQSIGSNKSLSVKPSFRRYLGFRMGASRAALSDGLRE
jgi:hypothetical protein